MDAEFDEFRWFWTKTLGISGPHWMILMALAELDRGEVAFFGVPFGGVLQIGPVDGT